MKFYYLNWDDYSFHEVEGEYIDKVSPYSPSAKRPKIKYAKLEGIEKPVGIDYPIFSVSAPNYSSNLEVLRGKLIEWVEGHILYHKIHIQETEKTLDEIKNSLYCFEKRTKHLFENEE